MEEPPAKKNKFDNCIICNSASGHHDSRNVEEYTSFLINQLVPPNEKQKFCGLKTFSFCINCLDILEELIQLKVSLDFLIKSIEKKKFELKCKIVQNEGNCDEEIVKSFRKITTRSLRPKILMHRNNVLTRCNNISKLDCKNNKSSQSSENLLENLLLSLPTAPSKPKTSEISIESFLTSQGPLKDDGMISYHRNSNTANTSNTKRKSYQIVIPSLNLFREEDGKLKINPKFSDFSIECKSKQKEDSFGSDSIKLEQKQQKSNAYLEEQVFVPPKNDQCPVNNSESVKAEVWDLEAEDDNEFQIHNWEELGSHKDATIVPIVSSTSNAMTNNIENDDDRCFIVGKTFTVKKRIVPNKKPTLIYRIDHRTTSSSKNWPKPMMTMSQFCYLAILWPIPAFRSLSEISEFVKDNFPSFKDPKYSKGNYLEVTLKPALLKNTYFTRYFDEEKKLEYYCVRADKIAEERGSIYKYLCSFDILTTMAFPGVFIIGPCGSRKLLLPQPLISNSTSFSSKRIDDFKRALDPNVPVEMIPLPPMAGIIALPSTRKVNKTCKLPMLPSTGDEGPWRLCDSPKALDPNVPVSVVPSFSSKIINNDNAAIKESLTRKIVNQFTTHSVPSTHPTENTLTGQEIEEIVIEDDDVQIIPELSPAEDVVNPPVIQYMPVLPENTFTKPPITCEEICFCAIMNVPSLLASSADILRFIRENYPLFYDPSFPDHLPISNIESTLNKYHFRMVSKLREALPPNSECILSLATSDDDVYPFLYTVQDNSLTEYWRKRTASTLSCKENLAAMAFPDRVYGFIKNVLTRRIIPDAYLYFSQNQQNQPEEIQNQNETPSVHQHMAASCLDNNF